MKYEYRLEDQIRSQELIGHLNALGADGWHVISLTVTDEYEGDGTPDAEFYTILLERALTA